jgi:hypothetical protein
MDKQNPIIKWETITVKSAEQNSYGDLIVNETLKVGKKRSYLFEVFQVGAEVKLGYSSYMNKDYIATAEQTGKHYPLETSKPISQAPQSSSTPPNPPVKATIPSGQEIGLWWKELGEMIRGGDIDKKTPMGKALRLAYYTQMFKVLDLNPPKE